MNYQEVYEGMVADPKLCTEQGAVSKTLFEKVIGENISLVDFRELHIKHLKDVIANGDKLSSIKAIIALEQVTDREGEILNKDTDEETVDRYITKAYPTLEQRIINKLPDGIDPKFAKKLIFVCVGEKTLSLSTVLSMVWSTSKEPDVDTRGELLLKILFSLESPSLFEILVRKDLHGQEFPVLKPLIEIPPLLAGKLRASMGLLLPRSSISNKYEGTKNVKHELNDVTKEYIKLFNEMPFGIDAGIMGTKFKVPTHDKVGNLLTQEERETIVMSLVAGRAIASFKHAKLYLENKVDNRYRCYNVIKYAKPYVYALTHEFHRIDTTL